MDRGNVHLVRCHPDGVAWQVISLGTATHPLPLLLLARLWEVRGCNPFVVIKFESLVQQVSQATQPCHLLLRQILLL